MTTIGRTPEARVIEYAVEYATLRGKLNHVNARRADRRPTEDVGRLFDALVEAEMHLLTAVKHLPQCLSEDVVTNVIPGEVMKSGGE